MHGAAPEFKQVLRRAGVIDSADRWTGGRTTLVQTGDVTDRGPHVRDALDLLMRLEREASSAGGRVVGLLGNHEVMAMTADVRDATPAIFATFADQKSEERRESAYRAFTRVARSRAGRFKTLPDVYRSASKEAWLAAHPPGLIEYIEAFARGGRYGRWLRSKRAVAQVGETVFLHGGLHPDAARLKIPNINERIEQELETFDRIRDHLVARERALPFFTLPELLEAAKADLALLSATGAQPEELIDMQHRQMLREFVGIGNWWLFHNDGPLWFRGYATWGDDEGDALVTQIVQALGVSRIVVGHTVLKTTRITPRFGGRIFLIDTGMLAGSFFPNGRGSALEIQGSSVTAIYEEGRVQLTEGSTVPHP